jgi:hypothetical protein
MLVERLLIAIGVAFVTENVTMKLGLNGWDDSSIAG